MKQNKYDDPQFFEAYSKMDRSTGGLTAAGEWDAFCQLLPDVNGKRVLDLGCGYGWHCRYFEEKGASEVLGIDLSEKMIAKANELTSSSKIAYHCGAIEDLRAEEASFDFVFSSLAFHYIADLAPVFQVVSRVLTPAGIFCYSTEHPIFTSRAEQDWIYDDAGQSLFWPVDGYFVKGKRETNFLGSSVTKYHRTLQDHFDLLRQAGLSFGSLLEPSPSPEDVETQGWQDEVRRPMFLILKAQKNH